MKITVLYGSARKNGISSSAAKKVLNAVRREEDEIREYYLAEQHILPCAGCLACRKQEVCSRKGDDMENIYKDVVSSDFVIFSSPVYCLDVTGPFKLMYDRLMGRNKDSAILFGTCQSEHMVILVYGSTDRAQTVMTVCENIRYRELFEA